MKYEKFRQMLPIDKYGEYGSPTSYIDLGITTLIRLLLIYQLEFQGRS